MMTSDDHLDGRIAQGWGGISPNGVHVNVVLASRGSATYASLAGAYTVPRPGFTPVLACVGETQPAYETVWPPTLVLAKSAPADGPAETLLFGAAQLGAAQGSLDAAAAGLVPASGDLLVFVSLWIDPAARAESAVRLATRAAVGAAIREAVEGRPPADVKRLVDERDSLTNPFYGGLSRSGALETQ